MTPSCWHNECGCRFAHMSICVNASMHVHTCMSWYTLVGPYLLLDIEILLTWLVSNCYSNPLNT